MHFLKLAAKLCKSIRSPSPVLPSTAKSGLADRNILTNVFTFSLAIVGEASIPGLKVAATALLDIIRRVESIKESKEALQDLAAHMEYSLFLSSKVKGDVVANAVKKLNTDIAELKRNIPQERNAIVAFFAADDTKARLKTLGNQLNMIICTFQIALQLNTDEKVEELLCELKGLKQEKQSSLPANVKQDLKNLELNAKRTLDFTVISGGRIERNISHSRMFGQDFNSLVVGPDGVSESMRDVSIEAGEDIIFTTVAGSPADLDKWRGVSGN